MSNHHLLPHHKKLLQASGISEDVAAARGYWSATKKSELLELGFVPRQLRLPALVLPVRSVHGEIVNYQIRPDIPRVSRDGKPIKYETAADSVMSLDVPPGALQLLGDPDVPLFITEGIRKADSGMSQGLCCIALLGVWNWRGTNDFGGKVALADWEYVHLKGRQVNIAFDSDVVLKPQVYQAMKRLADLLRSRGAQVAFIYLPPGPDGAKVGLDDFFAAGNTVADLMQHASAELIALPGCLATDEAEYFATPQGIVWRKHTQSSYEDVLLANFTAKIATDIIVTDGVETQRLYEIEAWVEGRASRFTVPADRFGSMNWVDENLGSTAALCPGMACRDRARFAIQFLSPQPTRKTIYGHTGWVRTDSRSLYLTAGGAIGQDGIVDGVEVKLPDSLSGFELPAPPDGDDLIRAVLASIRILDVGSDVVTVPLFSAVWAAILTSIDFSIHVAGPTGVFKSELAALVQRHWGPTLDARHLASWISTGNALEEVAFIAKDLIYTIDDFVPTLGGMDRLHRDADRLLRAQGNKAGRQRMRSDLSLRPARYPRGLILSTGEDVPRGMSLRARMILVEVSSGDVSQEALTRCQDDARSGEYARAAAAFIRWVAPQYSAVLEATDERLQVLRHLVEEGSRHRRTSDNIAKLALGLETFIRFAREVGAVSADEACDLWQRTWSASIQVAKLQQRHLKHADPAERFVELLRGVLQSGAAYLTTTDGRVPANREACGWTSDSRDPRGPRIGWLEEPDLYLEPDASLAAAQQLAKGIGEPLGIGSKALHTRLRDRGFLATWDETRGTSTIRKVIGDTRLEVLHLKATTLIPPETDHTDQTEALTESDSACELWPDPGQQAGD